MNKFDRWIKKKLFESKIPVESQLFRLMILGGVFGMMSGTIYSMLENMAWSSIAAPGIGGLILAILLVIGERFKCYDTCSMLFMMTLNVLILPWIFVQSGGLDSAMPLWLFTGYLAQFLILRGHRLVISSLCSAVADLGVIALQLVYPEKIHYMENQDMVHFDIVSNLIVVAILLSVVLYIQSLVSSHRQMINEQQQIELTSALETQSRFLANMSHEIRTPINTIIGLNEMTLREEKLSEEIEENALNIQSASRMLLSLINDILDLSKIEAGRMELVPDQYETGEIFSEIVNTTWIRAHEKNLEFSVNVSPKLPSMLYGDEVRIKQVLTNILCNAIKYTQEGSVTLFVDGEQTGEDEFILKMAVNDTGMGIRQTDIKHLFESFKRVNEGNTKGIEGTGLGLSISNQMVNLMGGRIEVDSVYQKGSTFTVIIPQKVINADPIGVIKYNRRRNRSNSYQRSFEAPEARVMVVDDNEMNLLVAKKLLRETKVQLTLAHSGKECLDHTMAEDYDIIFMDHVMPQMDGEECLKQIRHQDGGLCKNTPVIALTANAMNGAQKRYANMGFNDYLAKPINGMLFEAMLLRYLPQERIEYMAGTEQKDENSNIHVLEHRKKRRIVVSSESVADLPKQLVSQYRIPILNYFINTEHGHYEENTEIHLDSVVSYLRKGISVKTEAPDVEEYETFFSNILEEAEEVIHFSIADGTCAGHKNALKAAEGFAHVHVIDSGNLACGMATLVIEAAKLAQEETETGEILERLEQLKKNINTSFLLGNSKQLVSVSLLSAKVGSLMDMTGGRIMIRMRKSQIRPRYAFFGEQKTVIRHYIRSRLSKTHDVDTRVLYVSFAGCSKQMKDLVEKEISRYRRFDRIYFMEASSTVTCNCGLESFGLSYFEKRN